MSGDLVQVPIPEIPSDWQYKGSVKKVQGLIYKWKNLTIEIAQELYIARKMLSLDYADAAKVMHGTLVPRKTWTDYCNEIGSSRQVVNRWLKRWFKEPQIELETPLFPPGKFGVIYADPPWQYSNTGYDQAAEAQYPTLKPEEIIQLKDSANKAIQDLATEQTVLFLWATNPLVPEAIDVLHGWQFNYKTNMAWVKDRGRGPGWWLRSKHELIFIGTREKTPKPKVRLDSCFEAIRDSKHSRKPLKVYEFIEQMYPGPKNETYYVELFSRKAWPGWKAWGNEL